MDAHSARIWNFIAKCLGALWIFDGFLQFQPAMFGQEFVNTVLAPNLIDQPYILERIVHAGIYAWNLNPVVSDLLAALLQIGIGMLLCFPLSDRRFKAGAYLSIVWGIVVWLCGEGAGLLFTGTASFYTGAPGAVALYVALAVFLLMYKTADERWLPKIAGGLFLAGALLQLQPVFWTTDGIQGAVMAATMEQASILKDFPSMIFSVLGINPAISNPILIAIPFIVGLLVLLKPNRITGGIALGFLFLVWWGGQDFGMLTSGTGTDPNAAPLITLFLLPLFSATTAAVEKPRRPQLQ